MPHDIPTLWRRIDAALERHAPAVRATLAGPAREKDIAALEKKLGVPLPPDLRQSWAIHDGQDPEAAEDQPLFGDMPFHGLAAVADEREQARELAKMLGQLKQVDDFVAWHALVADGIGTIDGPVKARDYDPAWVPIGSFNGDVFRYVDLDPAPGGAIGQVIEVDPEAVSWRVLAPSFGDLLARLADELEAGTVDWEDGENGSGSWFPASGEMPAYLRAHAPASGDDAAPPAPAALASVRPGGQVELDVEVVRIIGSLAVMDVQLQLAGEKSRVWAQASARDTQGYKQIVMRAEGRCTLVREPGQAFTGAAPPEFTIERFELRKKRAR